MNPKPTTKTYLRDLTRRIYLASFLSIPALAFAAAAFPPADSVVPSVETPVSQENAAMDVPGANPEPVDEDICGWNVECPPDGKGAASEPLWREVTAYNVGIEAQTDSTPCIGATGHDLCQFLREGRKVVATNELPLYSRVLIDGVEYEVLDRMNSRYQHRYDIAMLPEELGRALSFGVQTLDVQPQ